MSCSLPPVPPPMHTLSDRLFCRPCTLAPTFCRPPIFRRSVLPPYPRSHGRSEAIPRGGANIHDRFFLKNILTKASVHDTIDKLTPKRLVGQAAKTSPSHGENGSSILPRVTKIPGVLSGYFFVLFSSAPGIIFEIAREFFQHAGELFLKLNVSYFKSVRKLFLRPDRKLFLRPAEKLFLNLFRNYF